MKNILIITLLLLIAAPCLAEKISITHLPAELRDQPSVSGSKVLKELARYAPLEVLETGADYIKVKTADGLTGYVHKSLTGKILSVVVTGKICNVRTGPGTEFPVAFKAYKGNSFKVLSQEQEWIQISSEDSKTGWIWQNLVW